MLKIPSSERSKFSDVVRELRDKDAFPSSKADRYEAFNAGCQELLLVSMAFKERFGFDLSELTEVVSMVPYYLAREYMKLFGWSEIGAAEHVRDFQTAIAAALDSHLGAEQAPKEPEPDPEGYEAECGPDPILAAFVDVTDDGPEPGQ